MKKYSKLLIFDYLCGNDIIGYNIDELENDFEFMIEVIKVSKDKNIYNLCSQNIKQNYQFVKTLIEIFNDDFSFLDNVVDFILKNGQLNEKEINEIIILMSNLEDNESIKYKSSAYMFYKNFILNIRNILQSPKVNPYSLRLLGKGFYFVKYKFHDSEIILKFFSKKMLQEIFVYDKNFLEQHLHIRFKSYDEFKESGTKTFMIKITRVFDEYLSDYLCFHPEVLDSLNIELIRIEKNWQIFEQKKYRYIKDVFEKYQKLTKAFFLDKIVFFRLCKELKIYSKMIQYCEISDEITIDIKNSISFNLVEREHYQNIKRIISDILTSDTIDYSKEYNFKQKSKIIDFSISKK